MCLGELVQVTQVVDATTVRALNRGREVTVSVLTLDDAVSVGDWLQTHAGFALARLTEEAYTDAMRIRETPA